ncbi:MAG: FAD-binding oxidoreductase [Bacteroidia bacterium]
MHYQTPTPEIINLFESIVGSTNVVTKKNQLEKYSRDYTEDLEYYPTVVLKPENAQQISDILRLCNQHKIAVTPRGAGTGLSGGSLPVFGGVVISMERFNKIIEIDERNFFAIVEPGVINEAFQNSVKEKGLFYPPDPASKGSCFLGGNMAHSSGGPRAVKYGTTRDYVLNMEVVLPTGEIIQTGANTLKYSTGYNLTQLMVGSEGTLGIITKITLKLIAAPKQNLLLLSWFKNPENACIAVNQIFKAGGNPSALEFVEPEGFRLSAAMQQLQFNIEPNAEAYLLIEIDGNNSDQINNECELVSKVLYENNAIDVLLADSYEQKEFLWKLRRGIGEATKHNNTYKEEDTVVPRAELPTLYKGVKDIANKYGFRCVCYGHAGDGNLHVNILKDNLPDDFWNGELKNGIREIFELCKKLGGTISGEHGIGLVQKEYMPIMFPQYHLDLMRRIKLAFDPNFILNPGKIF